MRATAHLQKVAAHRKNTDRTVVTILYFILLPLVEGYLNSF